MRISDWSSDVCSSDLLGQGPIREITNAVLRRFGSKFDIFRISGSGLCLRNHAIFLHQIKHDACPANGCLCVGSRGIMRRSLYQTGNDCRLGQAEVGGRMRERSEEHTSELQSLMRISYAVFCLKQKTEIYAGCVDTH